MLECPKNLLGFFYLIYPNMYRLGSKDPNFSVSHTFLTDGDVLGFRNFADIHIVKKEIQFNVPIIYKSLIF